MALDPPRRSDGAHVEQIGIRYDLVLVRYNHDGSLDTTFGSDGVVTSEFGDAGGMSGGMSVVADADGKIVVVG